MTDNPPPADATDARRMVQATVAATEPLLVGSYKSPGERAAAELVDRPGDRIERVLGLSGGD